MAKEGAFMSENKLLDLSFEFAVASGDAAVPISRYMPVLLPAVSDKASNSRPATRTTDRFCHQTCISPYSYPPFCNLEFLGFFL